MSFHPGLAEWLSTGEAGISSNAIVAHLTGSPGQANDDYPHDPSDFRRCQLLLDQVPTFAAMFGRMSTRSPEWAGLVARWVEIEEKIEDECPDYRRPPLGLITGEWRSAPIAYRMMREAIKTARATAP